MEHGGITRTELVDELLMEWERRVNVLLKEVEKANLGIQLGSSKRVYRRVTFCR